MKRMGEDVWGKQGLEGRYANHVQIGVNIKEVVLDFGQYFAEEDLPRFHTRIIMAPKYAKALLETLTEALAQFEKMSRGPAKCNRRSKANKKLRGQEKIACCKLLLHAERSERVTLKNSSAGD